MLVTVVMFAFGIGLTASLIGLAVKAWLRRVTDLRRADKTAMIVMVCVAALLGLSALVYGFVYDGIDRAQPMWNPFADQHLTP